MPRSRRNDIGWSFAKSRQVARRTLTAEYGRSAIATIRPHSVSGMSRSRAPLPLLLFIAARDGLVVEQDNGGYALLQPPLVAPRNRTGGYLMRTLRWVDRNWDHLVLAAPAVVAMAAGLLIALVGLSLILAVIAVLLGVVWVTAFLTAGLVLQLRWVRRMGDRSTPSNGRSAESLPGYHWSVPLVHQPDPSRSEDLMQLMYERLAWLLHREAERRVGNHASIDKVRVTETLVVLTAGITTGPARQVMANSARALDDQPGVGDVIMLAPPHRPQNVPVRPVIGGSFLLYYLAGLATAIAVCARFAADAEAAACRPSSCAGRPATYGAAVRWLLQRTLWSDSPGLSPGTVRDATVGWLISLAAAMAVVVAVVAVRQEIARNKENRAEHDAVLDDVIKQRRVLVLVVTDGERDAVRAAARLFTGNEPVQDSSGERTVHRLGAVRGTEVLLAQAGEQGILAAAGMLITATKLIEHCRPDYVVLTGICYGLRPDEGQHLGDVVIARRVWNIDHRKKTADGVIYRGVNVGCAPLLLDRFLAGQSTWQQPVRVHTGTVVTSNTLVDSLPLVQELRQQFPDAIAGEMEGTGVHEAASMDTKPDWIMVKAISDWGHDKTKDFQPLAARNAAEFVMHVIASGALRSYRRPR